MFLLLGNPVEFRPYYSPKRVNVTQKRELNRTERFCGGEDVTDLGYSNSDIHISGKALKSELSNLKDSINIEQAFELTSEAFVGEVRVAGGEYEGPTGRDVETGEFMFEYSLDLVSTGRDVESRTIVEGEALTEEEQERKQDIKDAKATPWSEKTQLYNENQNRRNAGDPGITRSEFQERIEKGEWEKLTTVDDDYEGDENPWSYDNGIEGYDG